MTDKEREEKRLFAGQKKPSMKRRSDVNNYHGRHVYMLTMAVEGRRPVFHRLFILNHPTMTPDSQTLTPEQQRQTDERFMRQALAEARCAGEKGEVPIGAVVVCQGRIIARTHNLTETLVDVTAHAEMQAITIAANELGGKYLTQCTLYVTVEPCTMCAGALGWAQLPRIVYGCSDPKRGFAVYAPRALHPRAQVVGGVLEEECRQLMQEFFRDKR